MRNGAKDAVQAPPNKAANNYNCENCNLAQSNMKELKFFEHAGMPLDLHGECAEAHKEQIKDVSISNVREHKEGEGRKRTRATTQDEECDKKLRST